MSDDAGKVLILHAGEGRGYALGDMRAVFKADEAETAERYSVSEWWLEPGCTGVGAHSHEANEEVFYVLAGEPSMLLGEEWRRLAPGAFVRIPAGVTHDFCNEGGERAGLLNFFIPGGFERNMPMIVDWFANQAAG